MNNHRKCRIVKPYYLDISINSENKTLFYRHNKTHKTQKNQPIKDEKANTVLYQNSREKRCNLKP